MKYKSLFTAIATQMALAFVPFFVIQGEAFERGGGGRGGSGGGGGEG